MGFGPYHSQKHYLYLSHWRDGLGGPPNHQFNGLFDNKPFFGGTPIYGNLHISSGCMHIITTSLVKDSITCVWLCLEDSYCTMWAVLVQRNMTCCTNTSRTLQTCLPKNSKLHLRNIPSCYERCHMDPYGANLELPNDRDTVTPPKEQ